MTSDITVYLRGGTYRVTSPLYFSPQDSGTGGHTVHWTAYPGEVPLVSGGTRVTDFSLFDSAKNEYRAPVPAGTQSRQLFVNGTRAQRAGTAVKRADFALSGSSFITSDGSYSSLTHQSQIEVVADNQWKSMRCPLESITATSSGGSSLNVDPACFDNNNTHVPNPGFPLNGASLPKLDHVDWIENAPGLLTKPGQFYLDSSASYLYYTPRTGENLATADVELPAVQQLLDVSGTPGHLAPVNDTDSHATYTGSWQTSSARPYGDLNGDVHYAQTDGDTVSYAFTGTGVQVLSENHSDEGTIDVTVDPGTAQQQTLPSVTPNSASERLAQQAVVSVGGLSKGPHTVVLTKHGGTYMLIDGFTVIPDAVLPVRNISFEGINFSYSTWTQPTTSGYIDNQAGMLWDPTTHSPVKIPAAVQVHRGNGISFTRDSFAHLGGTAVDLADGTQNSDVTGSIVTDTSGDAVSLGEVDDYYQTRTDLMTTGDTVTDNTIRYVGQDYHDAVGIWAGYTRSASISHNDVGYTPYSGVSLGWGWGWASSCALQAKQGLSICLHGSTYAGGNQITGNFVHNVMRTMFDGGPIYTLGGQDGGNGQMTSTLSGNYVAECDGDSNQSHMLYLDEGSSYWDTHDNVVGFSGGRRWVFMWTPTIHDNNIRSNYSDSLNYLNYGTNITYNAPTLVSDGAWPAAAQQIINGAGPSAQYRPLTGRIDDDEPTIAYSGSSWFASGNRGVGDYNDGIHAAAANGDSVSYTFTGTGIGVIGERNSDQGTVEIRIDSQSPGVTVDTSASSRQVQQTIWSTSGLDPTVSHTIQIIKRSGGFATLDGFNVTRTVNDDNAALQYHGSWSTLSNRGFGDYRDDVHYSTTTGDSVTVSFYGTGVAALTETNTDEGTVNVSLDGTSQGTRDANTTPRHAQQTLYQANGLPLGNHTLTLTKGNTGTFMVIDRFDIS
ncbi:hypothetical protein AB0M29_39640 [Streptomyces sp. NPDC051976]|uniref:hypothetical protein n=1 Tax=Streptomyces sp. NPDC051976 TaxID=3154947 RepID=UPI003439FA0A